MIEYQGISLHNVAETIAGDSGLSFSRLPATLREQLNQKAHDFALWSSGVELRFNILSDTVRLVLSCTSMPRLVEICFGSFWHDYQTVDTHPTVISIERPTALDDAAIVSEMPYDPHLVRVLLPWRSSTTIHAIEGDVSPARPEQVPRQRYLAYGSSITNGNEGVHPSGLYTARIGQMLGVDVINLGFGGGAHCESAMADYLAARSDWNFATLELGINMLNDFSEEEFDRRVHYFVETLVRARPEQCLFCLDIPLHFRDFGEHPQRAKCAAFRQIVHEIVADVQHPRCIPIDALALLDSPADLRSDLLHPAPHGAELIASRLSEQMRKHLDI